MPPLLNSTSSAPARATAKAISRPRPRLPPVTTAALRISSRTRSPNVATFGPTAPSAAYLAELISRTIPSFHRASTT